MNLWLYLFNVRPQHLSDLGGCFKGKKDKESEPSKAQGCAMTYITNCFLITLVKNAEMAVTSIKKNKLEI